MGGAIDFDVGMRQLRFTIRNTDITAGMRKLSLVMHRVGSVKCLSFVGNGGDGLMVWLVVSLMEFC